MTGVCLGVQAAYLAGFRWDVVICLFSGRLLVTVAVVGCLCVSFLCCDGVFSKKETNKKDRLVPS